MKEELLRKAYEIAVQSGRTYQNKETGYIHTDIGIPFLENSLFCLALFRSKMHEAVHEAKVLLDKLLYFQQMIDTMPNKGNFPLFLHEYPFCRDHYTAVKVAHVLVLIQKEFGAILGDALRARVAHSLQAAIGFIHESINWDNMPLWLKMKAKALTGEIVPFELSQLKPHDVSADAIGEMMAASLLVSPKLSHLSLYEYFKSLDKKVCISLPLIIFVAISFHLLLAYSSINFGRFNISLILHISSHISCNNSINN